MKRFFLFAAMAATVLVSCTKSELTPVAKNNAISFLAANYVSGTKAITGSEFPTTETFGAYAWTAGTSGEYFINNEVVSYSSTNDVWTTATPYYWPKNQSVDFFCYYPVNTAGIPSVAQNQIKYENIDFGAASNQVDFMYADKAVGFTDNANMVEDGTQSARGGVPTYFRHAGAKVKVNVILGDNEKEDTVSGTKTKWDVTVSEVILSGLYTKGSCTLNLSSSDNGVIAWTKPMDASNSYYVWTPVTSVTNDVDNTRYKDVQVRNLVKGVGQTAIPEFFTLPQVLEAGQQKISLKVTIKAYRMTKDATTGEYPSAYPSEPYLTQENKVFSADLLIDTGNANTSVFAWEMNQAITYNITLGPAGQQITFDPAVDAWDPKTYGTNIDISLGM